MHDAREIKEILESSYYVDNSIELYNEQVTRNNIISTFNRLQNELSLHDSLFIFFAGHGFYNKEISESGYIIPYDGEKFIRKDTN